MSAGRPRIAGITLSARSAGFAGIRACRRTTAGTSLAARTAAAAGPALAAAAHGAVGARVATEPAARPARATGTAGTSGAAGATIATIAAVTAAATEGVTTPKGAGNAAATGPAVTDQQPAGPASPARTAGTTHAARGSGIPVAAEATAATLGKAPSELVGEPTFPAVATEAAGSAGASDAAIATGAAGPAVTDQSRTVAGPTVLTGGTRPTVPAIAIQQSTRPTGLARPAVSAVADQRPANNAWVGALTALSTSCANVALAVSAAAYHPPPEVRAATNCARYAAACALICWYSCAFAPNSAAIAIDTSSAAVGRQRRRRACHERIGRADRRTDPRHICGGRGQKEGCAITNDM